MNDEAQPQGTAALLSKGRASSCEAPALSLIQDTVSTLKIQTFLFIKLLVTAGSAEHHLLALLLKVQAAGWWWHTAAPPSACFCWRFLPPQGPAHGGLSDWWGLSVAFRVFILL